RNSSCKISYIYSLHVVPNWHNVIFNFTEGGLLDRLIFKELGLFFYTYILLSLSLSFILFLQSALVLCMDVGFSMSNSEPGQEPPFEQAKKVIQKFIQRQVFPENKDEVGVVLFGTDDTKNRLAKDGQYENITVLRHLMMPDFELLEDIESKLQPGGQQADCILPFLCCCHTLYCRFREKKFERLNIVLLTDLNVQTSEDQLDIITENLKKAGITLQFFLPFPVDGEDRADGPGASARPGKGLSRQQTRGLEMVKHIMTSLEEEDGLEEVYTFSDALEKLSIFKCIDRRPMAWPCQLTIGGSLTIRIVRYKAIHLHQFMGSQVVKVFAPRDDECLHHRGVNPDDPLPPIEPWLKRVIERPQDVSARCQAPLQDIKTKFPLKVVVKKKEQRTSADMFGSRLAASISPRSLHAGLTEDRFFRSGVPAADPQDCAVARQQEPRVLHEERRLYPGLQGSVRIGELSIKPPHPIRDRLRISGFCGSEDVGIHFRRSEPYLDRISVHV
ncbi:X-ray repair cross-complementing protein 5-like, partial [Cyprinus carpio]|uniref:X-ray repair cross-complementing protein 5-like n=1 Tax=Cyprinus carpio TaxID=7962 RepID=A0A9R0B4Z0_CYPCA